MSEDLSMIPGVAELLGHIPLLADIPLDLREELSRQMSIRQLSPGTVLLEEGEEGHLVFFVLKGQVRIWSETMETWMAELGPGSMLGEIGALFGTPRTASVKAMNEVRIVSIPAVDLLRTLGSLPSVLGKIYEQARERYLHTHRLRPDKEFDEQTRLLAQRRIPQFSQLDARQQDHLLKCQVRSQGHARLVFGEVNKVFKVVMLNGKATLRQGFLLTCDQALDAGSTGTLDSPTAWLRLEGEALLLSLDDFYSLLDPKLGGGEVAVEATVEQAGIVAANLEEDPSLESGDLPLRHGFQAILATPIAKRPIIMACDQFIVDETPKAEPTGLRYLDYPLPFEQTKLVISSSCSEADLQQTIEQLSPSVHEVIVKDSPWSLDGLLQALAKKCPHLYKLDLSGSLGVSEEALKGLVSALDELVSLSSSRITNRVLQAAHQQDLLLEHLDVSEAQNLEWRHLTRFHATLGSLRLRRCWPAMEGKQVKRQFSQLLELDVSENPFLGDAQLLQMIDMMPNLQRLNVSMCNSLSAEAITKICQNRTLTHLDVSYCLRAVKDGLVQEAIAPLSGSLKALSVRCCPQLTNLSLKALLPMGLEQLNVSGCPRITALKLIPTSTRQLSTEQLSLS